MAFSTLLRWTKIFVFHSSFIRTNDKNGARLTDKSLLNAIRICLRLTDKSLLHSIRICPLDVDNSLLHAIRICPLDVDKSLLHCPSNNCIFPYKRVKTLVNFTKFDFFRKVLFELLENSRPTACYFQWNSWKLWSLVLRVVRIIFFFFKHILNFVAHNFSGNQHYIECGGECLWKSQTNEKVFCFNNCSCFVFRTDLVLVWFQCCPIYLSRKKGISGTFLSRPTALASKSFPSIPLFLLR